MSAATTHRLTLASRAERAVIRAFAKLPRRLIERLGANAPINSDGEQMAPEIAVALKAINRIPGTDFSDFEIEKGRKMIVDEATVFADTFEPFAIEEDLVLPNGIGATRYRFSPEPKGLVVYFHGGGWVLGNRVSTDSAVRFMARESGMDFLSVDYRLAPENPFPAAVEDGLVAWDFAVEQAPGWGIDPAKIALAGDSAGGNLTAVLAIALRDHAQPPALQVPLYPVTDLSKKHPSYAEFSDGFFLTEKQMDWYIERYLADPNDALDPRASPLLAEDVSGVAPAYIAVGGFDPLRDEVLAYAEKLRAAGVPTTVQREGSLIHAFINITAVSPDAREATRKIAHAIRDALS